MTHSERDQAFFLLGLIQERFDIEPALYEDNRLTFEIGHAVQETVRSYEPINADDLLDKFLVVFSLEWDVEFTEYLELAKQDEWE